MTEPQAEYNVQAEAAEAIEMLGAGYTCVICRESISRRSEYFPFRVGSKVYDIHFRCADWITETAAMERRKRGIR